MSLETASLRTPQPARSLSLREKAREVIRTQVLLGAISPGTVQSVQNIASVLGVSMTPVREAVMDLANLGMVEIIRNKGFRVPELSEHDLDEIYKLRTMLEVPAMVELTEAAAGTAMDAHRVIAGRCMEAARNGWLQDFLELDRQFHLGLIGQLNNRRLVSTVAQLRDQARMQGLQKLADLGGLATSAEEHVVLLDAIEGGKAELAGLLMRKHLAHSRGIWAGVEEQH